MSNKIDLTGKQFGRWKVLKKANEKRNNQFLWFCRCSCGNEKFVRGDGLKIGRSKSCGCLARELSSERIHNNGIGEKNYNYIHGRSIDYKKHQEFYESVRKRDNYKCQRCGKSQEQNRIETINSIHPNGDRLDVHHINSIHEDDRMENCTSLCRMCHRIVETKTKREKKIDEITNLSADI